MFSDIIRQVQEDRILIPDLMKAENGNNFRAISESAILDVINPILNKSGWFYEIRVRKSDLQIREAYGSKGKKLQFIATVEISVVFHNDADPNIVVGTESVGMGIDDNDKAMGKAYTYAVKYALLKLFRLRFGDDSDFEASKPLHTEKPKEEKKEEPKPQEKTKSQKSGTKSFKNSNSAGMDKAMTEAQRDYIIGMMKQKNVSEKIILENFQVEIKRDEFVPMPIARKIIVFLENYDDLPF